MRRGRCAELFWDREEVILRPSCIADWLRCLLMLLIAEAVFAVPAGAQPLTAAVSDLGNLKIKLEPVVNLSGFIPIDAATIPGDGKLYVGTYLASSERADRRPGGQDGFGDAVPDLRGHRCADREPGTPGDDV